MWQRRDDWIGSEIDDSFVMINLDHGTYVALNKTASAVWDLLADPRDEAMLVAALVEKFSVEPARCLDAVRTLLDEMVGRELIRIVV